MYVFRLGRGNEIMNRYLCLLCLLLWPSSAGATESCERFFQNQKRRPSLAARQGFFVKASQCFFRQFQQARANKDKKGRMLRNAIRALAQSLNLAVKRKVPPLQADRIRDSLIRWIDLHKKLYSLRKLSSDSVSNRDIGGIRKKVAKEIGYATLVVYSLGARSHICYAAVDTPQKEVCKRARLLSVKVLAGSYTLYARYRSNLKSLPKKVTVRRFQTTHQSLSPPFSTLTVVTNSPKATIVVKDKSGNQEPRRATHRRTFEDILIGSYSIIVNYGFEQVKQKTVTLRLNKPLTVTFSPPAPLLVNIQTQPRGARVTLDRIPRGETPVIGIPVQVGMHRIRIEKPCYVPVSFERLKMDSSSKSQSYKLRRDPVWLSQQIVLKQSKRTARAAGIALTSVGAAFVAVSAVMVGYGVSRVSTARAMEQANPLERESYIPVGAEGSFLSGAGLVLGGVGLGAIGPGLWYLLKPTTRSKKELPCQIRPSPKQSANTAKKKVTHSNTPPRQTKRMRADRKVK